MIFSPRFWILGMALLLPGCAARVWVADWKDAFPVNIPRNGAAAVVVKDKIHIIGGRNDSNSLTTTEYTTVQQDGSLAPWQFGPKLVEERSFMDAVVHGDYVYVIGGANGPSDQNLLRSVEHARIQADGTLGPWEKEENEMVMPRRCNKVVATDTAVYAFGGYGGVLLDSVESAAWQADGNLGEWKLDPHLMTTLRYIHSAEKIGDAFFIVGGHREDGNSMAEVEWSRLTPEGNLQEWQTATPMQQQRWGLATAVDKTYMYALGGLLGAKYLDSVEYTKVSRDNQLAPWHSTAPLDQPRATFSSVIYDGWIYVIGGAYPDGYLASVIYSGHNADGNIGFWGNQSEAAAAAALRAKRAEMARKLRLPNEGIVKDVLQAQAYTYLHLDSDNDGLIWVAGPKLADIKPGDRVGYNQGTPLTGFSSRELQRTFQRIILVGKMQIQ